MRASRRVSTVAFLCLSTFCLPSFAEAQSSDQVAAERVLGPRWKQLSRRAGMIFAGTVLSAATQRPADSDNPDEQPVRPPAATGAGDDSGGRVEFPCGRGDCRRRAWTNSHHSRVGGSMVHASTDEQGPAHLDLPVSAQSPGPHQPRGGFAGAGCSRSDRQVRVAERAEVCRAHWPAKRDFRRRCVRPLPRGTSASSNWSGPSARARSEHNHALANLMVAVLLICSAVASHAGGPAFVAGSGYNRRSRRPAADLGEWLGPVLHRPGRPQPDPGRRRRPMPWLPPPSAPGPAFQALPSPHRRADILPRT